MPQVHHQLRVEDIPASGGVSYHVDETVPVIREQLSDALAGEGAHRLRADLEITRTERTIHLEGRLALDLQLSCARCLEPFSFVEERTVRAVLLLEPPAEGDGEEEQELAPEELDESYLDGEVIDLPELLREQVLLALPAKPLCSEACKGLCPRCGADLNREACTCGPEPADPRMAVLQGLKIEEDN